MARESESCRQLMTVPGIGPIIASAMVAAIGNGTAFTKGRDFAAWLGWCRSRCRQGSDDPGSISKRGNRYLRTLFMQAPASFCSDRQNGSALAKPWIEAARKRLHRNVLAIALANKLARIAWTVLAQRRDYEAT